MKGLCCWSVSPVIYDGESCWMKDGGGVTALRFGVPAWGL